MLQHVVVEGIGELYVFSLQVLLWGLDCFQRSWERRKQSLSSEQQTSESSKGHKGVQKLPLLVAFPPTNFLYSVPLCPRQFVLQLPSCTPSYQPLCGLASNANYTDIIGHNSPCTHSELVTLNLQYCTDGR